MVASPGQVPRLYARFTPAPPLQHGAFARSPSNPHGAFPSFGDPMLDLILLVLGLGFFGLMAAYVAACDRV